MMTSAEMTELILRYDELFEKSMFGMLTPLEEMEMLMIEDRIDVSIDDVLEYERQLGRFIEEEDL